MSAGSYMWRPGSKTERSSSEFLTTVLDCPPDLLPHVFDPFTQADRSLDRAEGGLGIGLTLVRNLVELHGGNVEARSEGPGRGSEFIVPLARSGRLGSA